MYMSILRYEYIVYINMFCHRYAIIRISETHQNCTGEFLSGENGFYIFVQCIVGGKNDVRGKAISQFLCIYHIVASY